MHQHYLQSATQTLPIEPGDTLITYIYLDPLDPPSEIMLQWSEGSWEHRAYWGADMIWWGVSGTTSRHYMGPLPPTGQWIRLEVPASSVGLEGRNLSGIAFTLFGGRATWDRSGKIAGGSGGNPSATPTPSPTPGNDPSNPDDEKVFVDDSLPQGASLYGDGGDSWNWVSSNPTPFSGSLAHQSSLQIGLHQHYFSGVTKPLPVKVRDKLFAYVYLDPLNPPSEVMLQWSDGSWEHRAYWGADQIWWGSNGTTSRYKAGPLPPTGQWVRLEVPASAVGMEGKSLSGMAFTLLGGRATWDRAGIRLADPPLPLKAKDDAVATDEGASLTIDVVANDQVPYNDLSFLQFASVGSAAHGSVSLANQSVTYTPRPGFFGTDSFTYSTVWEEQSSSATVNITVRDLSVAGNLTGAGLSGMALGSGTGSSRVFLDGTWEVNGTGSGHTGTSDNYWLESQQQLGDFQTVVRLRSLTGAVGTRAGLVIREGTEPGDRFVMIAVTPDGDYRLGSRVTANGSAVGMTPDAPNDKGDQPDIWLLLERRGNLIRAAVSTTDSLYEEVASFPISNLTGVVSVGLFTSGGSANEPGRALFSDFETISLEGGVAGALPLPPEPLSDEPWQELILNEDGTIDPAEYVRIAGKLDQSWARDYLLGPRWEDFHPGDPGDAPTVWGRTGALPDRTFLDYNRQDFTPKFRPEDGWILYLPPGTTVATRPLVAGPGDWYSQSGNLLYVPDAIGDIGLARARAFADYHEQQGGAIFTHAFDLRLSWESDPANYFNTRIDPSVTQPGWIAATGGRYPRSPVALARSRTMHVAWPAVVVFQNGLIGATSNGNAPDSFPFTQLPAHKVPTAVALTQNNEFALVTVWNTQDLKGEVAVIALKGRFPQSESEQYWGLPNGLELTGFKILGYVELPGMIAPTTISAVTNVTRVLGGRGGPKFPPLDYQSERDKWNSSVDGLHTLPTAGFAVVTSRSENKVAFLDLQPLIEYFRTMYLTTPQNFAATKIGGSAPNQWPYQFSVAPQAKPVVSQVLSITQPTAVVAGYPYPSDSDDGAGWEVGNDFHGQAWVATMDGQLRIFDVGGLFTAASPEPVQLLKTVQLGLNPTCINVGRTNRYSKVFITCRGDREIYQLDLNATIKKRLRDSRLVDPVAAVGSVGRGPSMLSVMDFRGRQCVNYMREPLDVWGDILFGGLGLDGTAPFEFTFSRSVPGYPFMFDVTEVN